MGTISWTNEAQRWLEDIFEYIAIDDRNTASNVVIGNDEHRILAAANDVLEGGAVGGPVPEKWEGKAAERIVEWLLGLV